MAKGIFKKVARIKFVGKCGFGGYTWSEKVRTNKAANKAFRKLKKV